MAKKICSIIMALACCLSFAFPSVLAEEPAQCEHERGQQEVTVIDEAYCGHDGKIQYTCVKCGETVEEVEPMQAAEHNYVVDNDASTPLDCENNDGITVEVCKNCGDVKTTTVEHSGKHVTEIKNAKDATCIEDGYTGDEVCTICGKIVKTGEGIDALGHTFDDQDIQNKKDATCTEKGYTGDKVCTVCGTVEKGEEIPATGHLTETQNKKDATCSEKGYTGDKVCKVCGTVVEKGEEIEINPEAHNWDDGEVLVKASCTKEGSVKYICKYCGAEKTEVIPFAAHTYVKVADAVEATCEEDGKTEEFECSVCGHKMGGETIPALGHKTEVKDAKAVTCKEDGYTGDEICTVCGKTVKAGEVIPAAHDWDYAHQQVEEATCTKDGKTITVCQRCGETMTSVIKAKGHNKDIVVEAKAPTCEEGGNREYYRCSYCKLPWSYQVARDYLKAHGETDSSLAGAAGQEKIQAVKDSSAWEKKKGNTDEYKLQPLGHDYQKAEAVSATCTEAGNKEYYTCSREGCGKFFMDKNGKKVECEKDAWVIEALGHKEKVVGKVDPTCTTEGATGDTVCERCGETLKENEVVPALGHTWVEGKKIDPTCTEIGYQYYTCSVCNAEKAEEIPALVHDYQFVSTTATCTEDGITTYTCAVCGEVMSYETPAFGHKEVVDAAKAPTCTETGLTEGKHCSVCGEVLVAQEVLDALGHSTEVQNEKDATCTEDGYTGDEVCTVCGEVITKGEVIPAFGHAWTLDPTKSYKATTEKDGLEVYYCPICGESYEKVLPKKDATHVHSYILTDKKTATCTEDGFETFKCLGCGDTYTTTYHKIGHKAATSWTVVKDATCTNEGSKVRYCTVCGDIVETATIDALGHKEVVDAAKAPTCTETGLTESKHCSVCGEVLVAQEVVPALGHKTEIKNAKEAICGADGYTGDEVCSVCGEVIAKGTVIPATGKHTFDNGVVTTAPTCTADGVKTYTCKDCGAVKTEKIPALGHKNVIKNNKAATYFEDGYTGDTVCDTCGKTIATGKSIAKLVLSKPVIKVVKGKNKITVKFNKVKDATQYQISVKIKGKWKVFNTTKTSYTVKNLVKGKKYKVRVRAVVTSGSNTAYSAWSKIKTVKSK